MVQCEDGRPWKHGTIIGHGLEDHSGSFLQDQSDEDRMHHNQK